MNNKAYNRVEFVDIAKGIGIILVVYGHSSLSFHTANVWLHAFHMPLFFFITGMCYNETKYTLKELFLKRWIQIIMPCIYFTIFISSIEISLGSRQLSSLMINLPHALWFLPVLFLSQIIVASVWKFSQNKIIRALFIILSLCCWYLCSSRKPLPYSLHAIPASVFFCAIGNIIGLNINKNNEKIKALLCFATLCILVYIVKCRLNLYENILVHPLAAVIAAIIGIYFIIFISIAFDNKDSLTKQILIWLGKNTLIIMSLHQFIMYMCRFTIKPFFITNDGLLTNLTYRILEIIISCSLLICLIPFINKRMKFLIGK